MESRGDKVEELNTCAAAVQPPERVILLPYQKRWVDDESPIKIWLASRQVGKSFAIAMEAVNEALGQKCNNLILSSSERQSTEVMRKVYTHLRYFDVRSAGVLAAERETREEVELPIGSRILSLPSNPDTVRGFSGNVFLDEFAFHRDTESIWRAMYPTVTRGYGIRITSTPNGKQNMFYRLWSGDAHFSRHKVNIHDARREGMDVDIEMLREGIADPGAWAQEFECEFLDEATAFLTYEMIAACEDTSATVEMHSNAGSELYLGVDVGRKHDLTVFWLLEKVGDVLWTRMVRKMSNVSFNLQRDYLYSLLEGTSVRRCCIDASGIGAQLAEEAAQRFGSRAIRLARRGRHLHRPGKGRPRNNREAAFRGKDHTHPRGHEAQGRPSLAAENLHPFGKRPVRRGKKQGRSRRPVLGTRAFAPCGGRPPAKRAL
jgi:phage FluMu gp28-like protein